VRRRRRGDLATRIEERIDVLLDSITPESIKSAPVGQVATAVGTLIEKARAIRAADAPSPEVLGGIIKRHVTDKVILHAIAIDLAEAFGAGIPGGRNRPRAGDGAAGGGDGVAGVG
jgi:hypothetical protein